MFQNAIAVVLQLCLASLAFAAPIVDETVSAKTAGNTWQYGTGGGIIGFIILILDIMVWSTYISFEIAQNTPSFCNGTGS
jgi:hypothetical protein